MENSDHHTSKSLNHTNMQKREPRKLYQTQIDGNKKKRNASAHSFKKQNPEINFRRSLSSGPFKKDKMSSSSSNNSKGDFEKNIFDNPSYREFLVKVNCPFCLKVQKDKIDLVKHLNENCSNKKIKSPISKFQIFSTNEIKCNICSIVFCDIKSYFLHLDSKNHITKCLLEDSKGKKFTEFLYCSCCKFLIPNNYTQLRGHLQHEIHEIKRKSNLSNNYYLDRGFQCIYSLYNGNKRFICISCPPPDFLFNEPLKVINHLKTVKHLKNLKKCVVNSDVFCCFCNEKILIEMILEHFTSEVHLGKENKITQNGKFELCFYCGFSCKSLGVLSQHMKSNCEEIIKILQEKGLKKIDERQKKTEVKAIKPKKHELKKERCILVKDDQEVAELILYLKKFGKITYVAQYDENNLVVEFKKEESVKFILLLQSFIEINGKKVDIKFFQEEIDIRNTSADGCCMNIE